MKRKVLLGIVVSFVAIGGSVSWLGIRQHLRKEACKQRGAALGARVEFLKQQACAQLHIGTSKDSVIRIFAENGFHAEVSDSEIEGTVYTYGCSPLGCGTDAALIGIRVPVDGDGTVVSEPVVVSIYTDWV